MTARAPDRAPFEAPRWQPKRGHPSFLLARLIGVRPVDTDEGEVRVALLREVEAGRLWSVPIAHRELAMARNDVGPLPGEFVEVEWLGEIKTGRGRRMHRYEVRVVGR